MLHKISGLLSVAMCFILVGSSYPIAKEAMESIPTWTFTFITFIIGFLFLLPLTLRKEKTNWFAISLKNWMIVSLFSLLGAVLYTIFLLYGLPSTSAISASVITSAAPAAVMLISVIFFREKLKANSALSVFLAVVSVIVMTIPASQQGGSNTLTGLFFLCLSTLSNALNIVLANKVHTTLKPLTMAAGVCLTGAVFSSPMAIYELQSYQLSGITQGQAMVMLYYGIFVWALAYIFFFRGITRISAASAGMCVAITPIASMACAVIFFGDSVRTSDLLATIIIIFSIIFSEIDLKKIFKRSNKIQINS
ncbi:DMT family transporter [Pantoea sp. B65]|uniref:DMT family transporter n=1 Tax=Pantoea sp. B65 TaxID=2813359 RepID=UPI0039B39C44